jgi:hypothetical protein
MKKEDITKKGERSYEKEVDKEDITMKGGAGGGSVKGARNR